MDIANAESGINHEPLYIKPVIVSTYDDNDPPCEQGAQIAASDLITDDADRISRTTIKHEHITHHDPDYVNDDEYGNIEDLEEDLFECHICHTLHRHKHEVEYHITKFHTKNALFRCDSCFKSFYQYYRYAMHIRNAIHTGEEDEDNPHECHICYRRFGWKRHYTRHMITHMREKPYQCNVCYKRFSRKDYCSQHTLMVHRDKPDNCKICHRRVTYKDSLTGEHICSGENPYECHICHKRFARAETCAQHLQLHAVERSHQCSICYKHFSQRQHHQRHMRSHVRDKSHKCSICHKRFSRNGNYTNHIRIAHNDAC